jgi:ribonuclease VapC
VIVDASAILAIVFGESDHPQFSSILKQEPVLRMSAVNYLEAAVRIDGSGDPRYLPGLDLIINASGISIVPVTHAHALLAREAYRRFGKGNHKARLNLGDCFAYALAKESGEPLLFKGNDFRQTDIQSAL